MNELFTLRRDLTQVMALISLWIPQIFCQKYLFWRVLNENQYDKNKRKYIKKIQNIFNTVTSTVFESKDEPTQMTKQSFTIIYFITYKKTIHFKLICKNVHS